MILLEKYKKAPIPLRASFWFLVAALLQKGISMITIPIFTRIMSTVDYGRFSVFSSWSGIITIFATLSLSSGAFMRGLIKYEDDRDVFTSSVQGLMTTTVLLCFLLYILFHEFWNDKLDLTLVLMIPMFANMITTTAFQFWSNNQRVNFKYKKLVAVTLLNTIAIPVIGVISVLNTTYKVEARVISAVVINVLIFGVIYLKQAKKGRLFYSSKYWKYVLTFNLPLIPHYLSQVVLNQSDRIMINSIVGTSEAGIYSVAYSLAMALLIVNSSVLKTLNPWIYKKIDQKEYRDIANISYVILMLIAIVNLIFIAIAPELITLIAPKAYVEAMWIIPPVAASVFFMFMYSLFADFEFYFEKTNYIMIASIIGATINVALNYIFINKYGFIAAGYTTLICYILYVLAHYVFMRKINNEHMDGAKVYNGKVIIGISLLFLLLSSMFMVFYGNVILRYLILTFIIAITFFKKNRIKEIYTHIKY